MKVSTILYRTGISRAVLRKEKNMTESTAKKHLTLEDRTEIQDFLHKGMTFNAIARRIGKDPTTVSKTFR